MYIQFLTVGSAYIYMHIQRAAGLHDPISTPGRCAERFLPRASDLSARRVSGGGALVSV